MSEQTRLDALLLRYEELRAQDAPVSPEELCQECPELLVDLKRQIQDVESMNAWLGGTASEEVSTLTRPDPAGLSGSDSQPAEALSTGSRYQVLRFHAKGGLGEVHVARDEELHREVALKRLQSLHARNPQSRQRFLREAEITSRLEHPSIVPVHSVGQDANGRPFYAMRFIQGQTLQEAIEQFHAADGSGQTSGPRPLALRQLLSRFVAVCNTVAYAHSRGVVHRDLKPSNIMLGPYGETLVVDWGLAKEMAAPEGAYAPPVVSPETGTPTLAPSCPSTQTGVVIGTPTYMSPEQAEGRWDVVGPASDLYSLGATLYVLLTGQRPFEGRHEGEILELVKRGEFPPPRQRQKAIPPALEAICLKAMARLPEQRYATALDVAADLEHWLADEPVSAWPEPWTVWLRRWLGRHRTLATAAAAAVGVATAASVIGLVLLAAANDREHQQRLQAEEQRNEAERQREKSDASFALARGAVDGLYTEVSENVLLNERAMDPVRKQLLEKARGFYEKLVEQQKGDPRTQAELGRTYLRLARITAQIASKDVAIQLCQEARNTFDSLASLPNAAPELQRHRAEAYELLGNLWRVTGQPGPAEVAYTQAASILDQLAGQHPHEADYQNERARSHLSLGTFYRTLGRGELAKVHLTTALNLRAELTRAHPTVLAYQIGLADVHNNLAIWYNAAHQYAKVEEHLLQSLALREQLARDHPQVIVYQSNLGDSYNNLGALYDQIRRWDQAQTFYKQALTIREQLVYDHPAVSDYQSKLARSYHALGSIYGSTDRPAEAEAFYRKGLAMHEDLVRAHPTVTEHLLDRGKSYGRLGHLFKTSNPQAALEWFDQSARTHEGILHKEPQHAEARICLGYVHAGRGWALSQLHRDAEALEHWEQALRYDDGRETGWRCLQRAATRARLGQHAAATAEAQTVVEQATIAKPPDSNRLVDAACVYALCCSAVIQDTGLDSVGQARLAELYAVRAVELLTQAGTAGHFRVPAKRKFLNGDPDLEPLRCRADFKKLVQELERQEPTRAR